MEATRISQSLPFDSVFLLSYSRLRSSPSTWICAPLVSVLANSESLPKTTQRCHSVCERSLPSFLWEDWVADERVVPLRSGLLVRASGLLPRKPMRVTLFWYMIVSPFVEFARCCSGHTGRSLASGPGSQVPKVCFLGGTRKKFERRSLPCFSNLFWEEPRPRRGAQCEAEDRVPPGAGKARSCDRARDGIRNGRHVPDQSSHLPD